MWQKWPWRDSTTLTGPGPAPWFSTVPCDPHHSCILTAWSLANIWLCNSCSGGQDSKWQRSKAECRIRNDLQQWSAHQMSQPRAILHRDSHQVRLILSAQQLEADASTALIQTLPNAYDLDPDQGLLKHVPGRSLHPLLSPSCLHLCHLPEAQLWALAVGSSNVYWAYYVPGAGDKNMLYCLWAPSIYLLVGGDRQLSKFYHFLLKKKKSKASQLPIK